MFDFGRVANDEEAVNKLDDLLIFIFEFYYYDGCELLESFEEGLSLIPIIGGADSNTLLFVYPNYA